ncbi:MAG: hypothetical protein E7655_01415 [Ruminococcaceae bacterium]|nr:hypothetical protein [Oscillospiraceae bacterium]
MDRKQEFDKKLFFSPQVQQPWAVHKQAFGPLLEKVFSDDYTTLIRLVRALSVISQRRFAEGEAFLEEIRSACRSDKDSAVLAFFKGLCREGLGDMHSAFLLFHECNRVDHGLCLAYMKEGRVALMLGRYENAGYAFEKAVDLLEKEPQSVMQRVFLSSCYAQLSSAQTMLFRYEEAVTSMKQAELLHANQPGRCGIKAMLEAAMGNFDNIDAYIAQLRQEAPQISEGYIRQIELIRQGTHPHFFRRPLSKKQIHAFWEHFESKSDALTDAVRRGDDAALQTLLEPELKALFPYIEQKLFVFGERDGDVSVIVLHDLYMTSLSFGMGEVIDACPIELKKRFRFMVKH